MIYMSKTETDLIEVSPWNDFKIDEPVIATSCGEISKRYFAGVSKGGLPTVWPHGATRWSGGDKRIMCESIRRPTEDELMCDK